MSDRHIKLPPQSRQVVFHQLLVAARKTVLIDALREALGAVNHQELKKQLAAYIPDDVQQILASAGVRDEFVFPTPIVLSKKPTLVGYYRLLLGEPQKAFYAGGTGMGLFKGMEFRGQLRPHQRDRLPEFCKAMSSALAAMVRRLAPQITQRDVFELPLLTLGAQFQGSNNTKIGKEAIKNVFLSIKEIVRDYIEEETERCVILKNSAGRKVMIQLGADPDVGIQELFGPQQWRKKVAIEIKGGTDQSNVHNRAGEAEKSHQKAKNMGYRDFWTIISKKGLNIKQIVRESPTTNSWFDVSEIFARNGPDWESFRGCLSGEVGIPLND